MLRLGRPALRVSRMIGQRAFSWSTFSAASRIRRSDPATNPHAEENVAKLIAAWRRAATRSWSFSTIGGVDRSSAARRLRAERGRHRRARSAHCQDSALVVSRRCRSRRMAARARDRRDRGCAGFRRTFAVRRPLASAPTLGTTCGSSSTRPTRSTSPPGWRVVPAAEIARMTGINLQDEFAEVRDDRGSLHVTFRAPSRGADVWPNSEARVLGLGERRP